MRKIVTVVVACTLVLGLGACGGDDDDDVAASDDSASEMPSEVCAAWNEWGKTGGAAEFAAFRTAVEDADDVVTAEILDAVTALETQQTDTADGQAAYEGAFDFIYDELETRGCPPSRGQRFGAPGTNIKVGG